MEKTMNKNNLLKSYKIKQLLITLLPAVALAVLFAVFCGMVNGMGFRLDIYLKKILNESVVLAVIATGAIFIYSLGSFDISLGASTLFSATLGVMAYNATQSFGVMIAVIFGVAVGCSLLSSVLASVFHIPVFVTTVAMMSVLTAVASQIISVNGGALGGISIPSELVKPLDNMTFKLVMLGAYAVLCIFVFNFTKVGRRLKFLGGNPVCAKLSGIPMNKYAIVAFVMAGIGVGGMMYRTGPAAYIQNTHRTIQSFAKIPLLLAANTEAGGSGIAMEGTGFGCPMAVAATDDAENGYRMGYVSCKEGAALGLNWSFAPIVDIDMDFHNPITNTRTFGSDPDKVIAFASRYMDAADENGVAVAIKHFPGDGVDERDQHILTSINSLSCGDWIDSYGKVYKTLIGKGAKTVMVGHIAPPAWVKKLQPDATRKEQLLPASLSKPLLTGLLRETLGFNGLVSTDATPMVGFTSAMPRSEAIPAVIAAGADMILFNKSLDEDYNFLLEGLKTGKVTEERLNEAVMRILATKTSLHLPEKQAQGKLVPGPDTLSSVGCQLHKTWAQEVADQAVTLVRDEQHLLPISPKKFRRVY